LVQDGCDAILATFITDHVPVLERRIGKLVELREKDDLAKQVIQGIHIEGPFINPIKGYVGAHPPQAVKAANVDDAKRLLDAAGGLAKLMTLAPEHDEGAKTTAFLASQGIVVSAGHCDPTLDQLRAACDAGLSMFTHVGNGCPVQMHRHDNIIQRALSLHERLWLCFIPDGVHIPFFVLKNWLASTGLERAIFVTDAISAARLGPGRYTLAGWDILIGDDLVARSPDGTHFVGSTVTVPRIRANALNELGMSEVQLTRVLDTNPRRAMGVK
ncbi:MAG: N-acetylglucosamine-6-phosphate deacetylase, partial [Verrucomicrobiaceae bacterium]|nr:N-acetylglucosamine-6-phosphate deacetylase [Verrucomicrobiaceae bacterium]